SRRMCRSATPMSAPTMSSASSARAIASSWPRPYAAMPRSTRGATSPAGNNRRETMSVADTLRDLVIANRILAHEEVVDAYGHISVRHPDRPDRFFLSGSRSPELVTLDDIIEYDLDCNPIDQRGRAQYTERPIHGGIYKSR